jgi:hypothetical protein
MLRANAPFRPALARYGADVIQPPTVHIADVPGRSSWVGTCAGSAGRSGLAGVRQPHHSDFAHPPADRVPFARPADPSGTWLFQMRRHQFPGELDYRVHVPELYLFPASMSG